MGDIAFGVFGPSDRPSKGDYAWECDAYYSGVIRFRPRGHGQILFCPWPRPKRLDKDFLLEVGEWLQHETRRA
jgi:hypothetical protein